MSIAIPRRARRALLAAAVPAALAAASLPAAPDAASVRVVGVGPTAVPQLQYTAAAGENNDVRVAFPARTSTSATASPSAPASAA